MSARKGRSFSENIAIYRDILMPSSVQKIDDRIAGKVPLINGKHRGLG
jgi:hypothetical protein